MKPETMIFDIVREIVPDKSEKNVFFVGMTDTSQETYFYSFFGGKPKQCFSMAEEGALDENVLLEAFSRMVKVLRESKIYVTGKYNVATIVLDKSGIKLDMEYHDMDTGEYKIQKEWKKNNVLS